MGKRLVRYTAYNLQIFERNVYLKKEDSSMIEGFQDLGYSDTCKELCYNKYELALSKLEYDGPIIEDIKREDTVNQTK